MPQQRALAATTDTHNHECLAAMNVKRDVIEHSAIAECVNKIGYFDEGRVSLHQRNDECRMVNDELMTNARSSEILRFAVPLMH